MVDKSSDKRWKKQISCRSICSWNTELLSEMSKPGCYRGASCTIPGTPDENVMRRYYLTSTCTCARKRRGCDAESHKISPAHLLRALLTIASVVLRAEVWLPNSAAFWEPHLLWSQDPRTQKPPNDLCFSFAFLANPLFDLTMTVLPSLRC